MNNNKLYQLLSKLQSIFDRVHFYYLEQGQIAHDPIVNFLEQYFRMPERYVSRALNNSIIAKGTPKIYYVLSSFYYKGKYDSGKNFQHLNTFSDQIVLKCTSTNGCDINLEEVLRFYCCVLPNTIRINIRVGNNPLIELSEDPNNLGILIDNSGNIFGTIDHGICENVASANFTPAVVRGVIQGVQSGETVVIDVLATTKCLPEKYFDLERVSYDADIFYVDTGNQVKNYDIGKAKNVTYTVSLVLNHLVIATSLPQFYLGLVDYSHRLILINKLLLRIRRGITVLAPLIINLKAAAGIRRAVHLYGYTNVVKSYVFIQ